MIVAYPLAVAAVVLYLVARRGTPGARGRRWFAAWACAGALLTFSFLTGLSIGLLLLPFALVALFLVAREAPQAREAAGFLAGLGAILLLVAAIGRPGAGWALAGVAAVATAVAAYRLPGRRSGRVPGGAGTTG